MATTTNFGWTTPDDTGLVKDGASAIRTLGSAIDTSLVKLKGGTTGQVLQKASNTDLDYSWTAIDPLTILDAKGDLISATAADTPARLAVGTNGQILTADSTTSTGLKWATLSSWSPDYQLVNAGGTALTGANSITVSGISGKNGLLIYVDQGSSASASSQFTMQFNSDTGANYNYILQSLTNLATAGASAGFAASSIDCGVMGNNAANKLYVMLEMIGSNNTGYKPFTISSWANGSTTNVNQVGNGFYIGNTAISSVTLKSSVGNFDGGTIYVYGA